MSALQDAFLPAARRDRLVVAEFDQGSTAEATVYPGGYCAGLTVQWLARRTAGKNWPSPQGGAEANTVSAAAAATYAKYVSGVGKANKDMDLATNIARKAGSYLGGIDAPDMAQSKTVLKEILGSAGMSLDEETDPCLWKGGGGQQFIHEVAVLGAGYYYISIKCSQGTHALGLQIASRQHESPCEFFDPNIGHLRYNNPTQLKWSFSGLLVAYIQILQFNFNSGFAMRVRPPQLKF